jgi:hypothetical protein
MSFFSHVEENNLTYFQHMRTAFSISYQLISTGIKSFVHGIFPPVWQTSASDKVRELNQYFLGRHHNTSKQI